MSYLENDPSPFIAATCFNRPHLLNGLLDSIAQAHEVAGWQIRITVDPSDQADEIRKVVDRYSDRLNLKVRFNSNKLGVRENPHSCINWCLEEGAAYILLLEDDLLIDPQALLWSEDIACKQLGANDVMCANLLMTTCNSESIFCPRQEEREKLSHVTLKTRNFSSIGLLFSRQAWEAYFQDNWFADHPVMVNWAGKRSVGWDVAMNRRLLQDESLFCLQSLIPRVKHLGGSGTHATEEFQARSFDNISINSSKTVQFHQQVIFDPLDHLLMIESESARMYINLNRHLWTLQKTYLDNIKFRDEKDIFSFGLGSLSYRVARSRCRR